MEVTLPSGSTRHVTDLPVASHSSTLAPDGTTAAVWLNPDADGGFLGLYLLDTAAGGCGRRVVKAATGPISYPVFGDWLPGGQGFVLFPYPA